MDQTDTQQAQSERKAAFQIAMERAIAEGTAITKRSPAVPRTIYHYTDAQGLMGIQSEQKLWATNAKFLNDEYELSWAMNVYNNTIRLAAPESEGEQELLERISRSANLLHSGLEIFCCSFSEKGDDLNQWRGYAGTTSPYAIGMRAGRLSVGISYAELMSVIYDEAEQLEIASALVDLTLHLYRDHADKAAKPYDNEVVGMCSHAFRVMSSYSSIRFKSPHWSSEHEWRLIAVLSSDELKANMHFKAGRFGVVPYMKLGMDVPGIHNLPIEEVVVGPTPLREASLEATRMYFHNQDMMTPDVRASTVPIR